MHFKDRKMFPHHCFANVFKDQGNWPIWKCLKRNIFTSPPILPIPSQYILWSLHKGYCYGPPNTHLMGWKCWINTVGKMPRDDRFMTSSLVVAVLWIRWGPFTLWAPKRFCHLEKNDSGRAIIITTILLFLPETAISKCAPFWIEKQNNEPMFLFPGRPHSFTFTHCLDSAGL